MNTQMCFLTTKDKNSMSSNSSSCTIPLSQPLTATHFRFINANVPNTGYTFKSDNRNLHLFKKLTPTTTWENVSGVYQAYLEMSQKDIQ